MVNLETLRAERRDEIMRLAGLRGAHSLRVFGSVARGEANEDSDLDLLVAWEPGRSLMDHAGLVQDLQELLGIKVHVGTKKITPLVRSREDRIEARRNGARRLSGGGSRATTAGRRIANQIANPPQVNSLSRIAASRKRCRRSSEVVRCWMKMSPTTTKEKRHATVYRQIREGYSGSAFRF